MALDPDQTMFARVETPAPFPRSQECRSSTLEAFAIETQWLTVRSHGTAHIRRQRSAQLTSSLYDMDVVFDPPGSGMFSEVYLYEELMEADLHAIVSASPYPTPSSSGLTEH